MTMAREPFPVDHDWAWVIVCGCFLCLFIMMGIAKSTGLFLIEFQEHFEITTSKATMMMGAAAIVYALFAPACIILGQTFTVRQVILTGTFIGFLGMSLGSLLYSMEYVIATFGICFGLGNASVFGNCLVILSMYFRERHTLASGLALAGASVGQFAMPPLIEYLLETYGLRGCLLLVSGIYLQIMVAASLFRSGSFWHNKEEAETNFQDRNPADDDKRKETDPTLLFSEDNDLLNNTIKSMENGAPKYLKRTEEHKYDFLTIYNPNSTLVFPLNEAKIECLAKADLTESNMICHQCTENLHMLSDEPQDPQVEKALKEKQEIQRKSGFCHKLIAMLDFSIMKSYVAVFIITANFLSFFGYFNFVLFLPAAVLMQGVTKYHKAILISVCGIGDLLGRLLTALVGDCHFVSRYKLQATSILAVGANIGGLIFADTFIWMTIHSALYGFFGGIYVSLMAVVIRDFVGQKNMPRLLAMVILIQGIGSAIAQPLLGGVKDVTGSYQAVLMTCTVSCLSGGVILLCYPFIFKLEQRRPECFQLLP